MAGLAAAQLLPAKDGRRALVHAIGGPESGAPLPAGGTTARLPAAA